MVRKFRRVDRPFEYIAHRFEGHCACWPSWFHAVYNLGKLRFDDEGFVEVRVITGQWQQVEPGEWVVLQRGGNIWLAEHEDFIKLWEEI